MTEQLKALAEAAKGWKFDHIQQCDDEPIEVGQMSDGEFYQIATIDCEQYGESSRPLAEYLVQASPERILALIAENERLLKDKEIHAFEDWLEDTCPSGDVEAVQRQWENSNAYKSLWSLK